MDELRPLAPHEAALDWIDCEHAAYQGQKFDPTEDDEHTQTPDETWWEDRINMYLNRAKLLGVENPLGRQAAAKAAATAVGYLESVFRVFGSVPSPGFTSGEHKGDFTLHAGSKET